ncbi:MAG: MFS transporter [Acidobacteria bacterium]|nr:MFS transporter [Acidobacteriota bacterium]
MRTPTDPEPDGRAVLGLSLDVVVLSAVAFCVALGFGIVAPALPIFARSFGVSATAASAVISVFALVRLVGATPAGALVDRVGERTTLAWGLAVVAVSSALAGLATTYLQLLVLRGVGGLGSAMFTVSAMSLLLRSVGPERRGRAAGVFNGGFLLGGVAGPALGGAFTAVSLRLPFFIYAGTLGLGLIVVLALLPRVASRAEVPPAQDADPRPGKPLRTAIGSPAYRAALAVNFANGFTAFGLRSALVPLFVVEGLQRSPALTGYGLLAAAAFQGALLWPAGRVSDEGGRKLALLIGTAVAGAGMALLALAVGPWSFLVSMAVLGVGAAFLGSAPAAIVGDVAGARRSGPLVAVYGMCSDIGAISGPLAAGAMVDLTGSFAPAFWSGAAVLGLALLLALPMPARQR